MAETAQLSAMEPLEWEICWEARNPDRNIARSYRLTLSCDVFGWFTVERYWGRIGSRGRSMTAAFDCYHDAQAYCAKIIRKRSHARPRLGTCYKRL
ncbi:WGR domain-containing protein [Altererythrobacter indicus]|uniref:WGR domain-containing protein n=1 Tax=Altericroceibacterium indicum TaxID=374177 RepID=A0A845A9I0_9SPHN|nr:WGR domain-containing protein [Altericroceibacterium indicum]MXP27042.1 WGR domain-containing protein [Altericroceibacterium indicum]